MYMDLSLSLSLKFTTTCGRASVSGMIERELRLHIESAKLEMTMFSVLGRFSLRRLNSSSNSAFLRSTSSSDLPSCCSSVSSLIRCSKPSTRSLVLWRIER
jgi:hypothetical protein